jgi:hypothetical protein
MTAISGRTNQSGVRLSRDSGQEMGFHDSDAKRRRKGLGTAAKKLDFMIQMPKKEGKDCRSFLPGYYVSYIGSACFFLLARV